VILEGATEGVPLARELAERGVPVVVTPQPAAADAPPPFDAADGSLAGRLAQAGATVAIASGTARDGRFLPLLAAFAAGKGMTEDAALRAITLTPAEVLGLGKLVGSLQPGKLADVVITTEPLLRSDARVLRVLAGGRTEYEAR
jgi:imidazolonepropionase-like amidohydrolase